ncbi:hypothetical protein KM043_003464 [Ampulex compressa]|nr:hypothetical protein KM043_003464 [Ampulex compressa]
MEGGRERKRSRKGGRASHGERDKEKQIERKSETKREEKREREREREVGARLEAARAHGPSKKMSDSSQTFLRRTKSEEFLAREVDFRVSAETIAAANARLWIFRNSFAPVCEFDIVPTPTRDVCDFSRPRVFVSFCKDFYFVLIVRRMRDNLRVFFHFYYDDRRVEK